MSSPTNRSARHLTKATEPSSPVRNTICFANPHRPKKEKGSRCTQMKNTLKPPDYFSYVGNNNSFTGNTDKSHIETSSSIVSKEASHQKGFDSDISSCGCVESSQSETLGIRCTKKSTRQENQCSPDSPKEHTPKNPSKGKEENICQLNCQLPYEHKNVVENNCEVPTTTEMYETSESLPLNTSTNSSTDNAVDKKKERRKIVKKLAKDEKRKQCELDYKKNLQYPKGQRIQVLDHNTFHKIVKNVGFLPNENKRSVLSSEEFPALNILKCNNNFPIMPCQNSSVQSDTETTWVQDKVINNMGEPMKTLDTLSVINGEMVNKTEKKFGVPNKLGTKGSLKKIGKLPKKRDPIQIDILQCIKMVKSKDAVIESRKKLRALERRNDSSLISGNELDASNPQRSRGKKREKPKKKRPTRLKLVILHERELRNQLKKLQVSDLSQVEKACFGTETSINLLTAGAIKLEQVEPVTNVLDIEVGKTVPGSINLLAVGDIKLEHTEPVNNVSGNEVVETVPGSTTLLTARGLKSEKVGHVTDAPDKEVVKTIPVTINLLTAGDIKLEQLGPVWYVSGNEVVEKVPGSTNLLTAVDIKLEKVEPVTNVSDNKDVETVPGVGDTSKEGRYKYEVPSSESGTAVGVTNQFLNAEDDTQTYLLNSLHIINNQPDTNEGERVLSLTPSLLCSASEILKKEKQEFTSSVKESCCIVNLKQGQNSVATADDDIKPTHKSSNVVKHEILHSSQIEHCIGSLETVSFTDPGTCNELHQMDCRKFPKDKVHASSSDNKETMQKTEIHSRKFRPYCDHFITPEINSFVSTLLQDIVKFHDRQFVRDPVKANARRRHVTGLREALKYLNLKRLKLIIIAPDMELIQGKGGICDIVEQLKEGARNQEIPYVFALQRRALGKITFKKVPVSCIGIINYDGTEKNFHSLVLALQVARAQYQEAVTNVCVKDTHAEEVDINKQVVEAALSRLTENCSASYSKQSHLCSETV